MKKLLLIMMIVMFLASCASKPVDPNTPPYEVENPAASLPKIGATALAGVAAHEFTDGNVYATGGAALLI